MKAGISFDGVHPNALGYAIMAPLAQAAIDKTLGGREAGALTGVSWLPGDA
jgi:lysophospholipase L1-like esterase